MERISLVQLAVFGGLALWPAGEAAAQEENLAGKAVVLEVGPEAFVRHAENRWLLESLQQAEEDGAAAIVLQIEVAGGLAHPTVEILEALAATEVPTVAFVKERAAGPGAVLALGADRVFLAPDAKWGGPIDDIEWREKKDDLPPRLVDRGWEDERDRIVQLLKAKGRPQAAVDGFLIEDSEVRIGGKLVAGDEELLILDAELASGEFEGGGEVPVAVAEALEEVLEKAEIDAGRIDLSWEQPEEDEKESGAEEKETATPEKEKSEDEDERNFGETRQESYEGKIVVLKIGDDTLVYNSKFDYLQRIIKKADEEGAEAIIFDMNTPGGLAWDTAEIMMKDLSNLKVPTYTFINTSAVSAGSLIAIATDHIYMHRPSNIGSAGVVSSLGELEGTMKQKADSLFKSVGRGVANSKGHPADVVEAFIDSEKEVVREISLITAEGYLTPQRIVVSEKGKMLNLDADQASQLIDGKPLLAEGIAQTVEEVIEKAGLKGEIVESEPLGFEMVADWIVKFSGWLLLFGIAGAYMELKAPGFGLPGAISLVCFGLFFFGQNVAGHLAGYEAVGVFLIGAILVIVEFFVLPGLLLPGLLGFLLMLGALVYAMIDPADLGGGTGEFSFDGIGSALQYPIVTMSWALGGSVVAILLIIRFVPGSPMFRWLTLDAALPAGASKEGAEMAVGAVERETLVGKTGVAITDLRPAGKVQIGDDVKDVVTAGELIDQGKKVRVVEASGLRTVVEVDEPA